MKTDGRKLIAASAAAQKAYRALIRAEGQARYGGSAVADIEDAWRAYQALGEALQATGVEAPQPAERT